MLQGPDGDGDDGEAPWHDQTMPIADRMKLAEGRPLRRRMMAAMAQQDCGQCGYNCNDYSEAIASKAEARLNLCVPGGKETARMLKALHEELEKAPAASPGPARGARRGGAVPITAEPGRSRDNPVAATFVSRRLLNKPGSEKETWHIDFDLSGCGLDYVVGDSFGIFARNDLGHVDQIIALLGASHTTEVRGKTLREVLDLGRVAGARAGLAVRTDLVHHRRRAAREGARAGARRGSRRRCRDARRDGGAAKILRRAAASRSLRRGAGAAAAAALFDLVVAQRDARQAVADGRLRALRDRQAQALGLASTFLAERINPGDEVKVYVQKAHGFALPQDPKTPIIMIGPGTGVAPFRAFLLDRKATGAPGKNWLFFGHQRSDCDFFYSDELNAMKTSGSADAVVAGVVARRRQEILRAGPHARGRPRIVDWLAEGANVYVCGDAKRMAKDVERALVDIVAQFGARTTDEAVLFRRGTQEEGTVPTGRLLIGFQFAQIGPNKILA